MSKDKPDALVELARTFLQETVLASRQTSHAFNPDSLGSATTGGCGMGPRPDAPDTWTPRQQELISLMSRTAGTPPKSDDLLLHNVARTCIDWIRRQDAIDRQRNHFLREFRTRHGFDRHSYDVTVEAAFREGIEAINAENRSRLDDHAQAIAALFLDRSPAITRQTR